jgi:hypothetical protein
VHVSLQRTEVMLTARRPECFLSSEVKRYRRVAANVDALVSAANALQGNCELEMVAQIGVSEAAMLSAFTSASFR